MLTNFLHFCLFWFDADVINVAAVLITSIFGGTCLPPPSGDSDS